MRRTSFWRWMVAAFWLLQGTRSLVGLAEHSMFHAVVFSAPSWFYGVMAAGCFFALGETTTRPRVPERSGGRAS